jgi:hypothetical protein
MKTPSWLLVILANAASFVGAVEPLPGTQPLTWEGDIPLKMVDDLHAFADRETAASVERRARHWNRDFSSHEAYEKSVEPNRKRLAKHLGVNLDSAVNAGTEVRRIPGEDAAELFLGLLPVRLIRRQGLDGNQILALRALPQDMPPRATVIVMTDLSFNREYPDSKGESFELIRRLYCSGCEVLILPCIDRGSKQSVVAAGLKPTDQPHREFIYRQAFEMGRHPIGYEIELIRGLIDGLIDRSPQLPLCVVGIGAAGRAALAAGALDRRIDVTAVCGTFGSQQALHDAPIDRSIWGYLDEFGDAELAGLIAPRQLVIDSEMGNRFAVPQPDRDRRPTAAPGTLDVPTPLNAQRELDRACRLVPWLKEQALVASTQRLVGDESEESCLRRILKCLGRSLPDDDDEARFQKASAEAGILSAIQGFQVYEMIEAETVRKLIDHTQALVRESEYVRKAWWKDADRASRDPEKWRASCEPYRQHLYDEVLGRFEHKKLPPNARTRKIYDEPTYTGYEVVLDVFSNNAEQVGVWAYGILLVPKNIPPGERRPVVVCQHGLEGRPQDTIEAGIPGERFYHQFAAKLAERGFITFSPQNPYIGKDHFRQLVRKLWPLKKTLWSFIVPQHEQITDWLASLEFVDPARIGFYGLSYGGKTAMRIPALVDRYCLSICSGDFNEWIRKITSVRDPFSYMGTHEYEIMEFDLGHTFNYAEMAGLIAPRPFMVERGHRDGVGIDEWVAYEYAKVQLLYADLKIPERTEIEYFDGPHEIHGVGTFDFLHRHLKWPAPK